MGYLKRYSTSTIIVTAILLVMLPLLAVLQYRWLAQLSERENERMKENMRLAALRFADDIDDEIFRTTMMLSFNPENEAAYNSIYLRWLSTTQFPKIVKGIYLTNDDNDDVRKYNPAEKKFVKVESPASFKNLAGGIQSIDNNTIVVVKHMMEDRWRRMHRRHRDDKTPNDDRMILTLDMNEIRNDFLPDIAAKYFSDNTARIIDLSKNNKVVYKYGHDIGADVKPDVSVKLMGVRRSGPRRVFSTIAPGSPMPPPLPPIMPIIIDKEKGREFRFDFKPQNETRIWELQLNHREGSLQGAVNKVRHRNLLISFGILGVLAAAVIQLLRSSRQAYQLAQRQMEFTAGISHELRTPLTVIKSAAWNLSNGVVKEEGQIKKYSVMIGKESDRLIDMIEDVLEYAGSQSNNPKSQFSPVNVNDLIDDVLNRLQPLLDEHGFIVEKK